MNYETAAIAARFECEAINRRASLMGSLGTLPSAPSLLPLFRRRVIAIPAAIEIRHPGTSEKARIARRLRDVAAQSPMHAERKAS